MKNLINSYEVKNTLNTIKIPNKITLIFDRIINQPNSNGQYIYTDIKYTDFIHISNLFTIIPNSPFIKLNSFSEEESKIYKIFIDKIKNIIKFISNIKNNKDNKNIGNIEDIIIEINDIIDYYFSDYKSLIINLIMN